VLDEWEQEWEPKTVFGPSLRLRNTK